MARSDNNLTAVFTDTANAIRSKTGGSSQISPRDFADEISTIEVVPASEYKQMLINLLQDTTVSITIPDEVTSLGVDRWKNDSYLTTIDFNNVAVIPEYTCYNCSNLTTAIFKTATTNIGSYAFYGCTKFEDTELPHTLTNVGSYAFYNAGSYYSRGVHTFTMIDNVGVHTTIGSYAFQQSHLNEITAYLNNVGDYAFQNCSSLTTVDVEIYGSLASYAFAQCQYVMDFEIDPNSVITSLGSYAFQYLGYQTYSDASFHMADFDFRNSTFTSVSSGVWQYCRFNGNIYFPSTLTTVSGNFLESATGNWKLYFNSIPTVSSSSYLRSDSGTTFTVKYLFPYDLLGNAAAATNWSSHTSQMIGYGTGFEAGSTLPQYTRETGVGITWYSDEALTQVVTTSSSATDIYYCTLGSTRLVWYINAPQLQDASVTISDGTNTYTAGDPVLVNTSITVTPAYTDPSINLLYMLTVNGVDYTSSGTATINMDQDLTVVAMYWDGEHQPFLPTLADNSWDMIKLASKTGAVPSSWAVGDTKTLTYNGTTFTARLIDKTGKFTRVADGSTAYLYFELTESLATREMFNSSGSNTVADSPLLISMNSGTIWSNLDSGLTSALEEVNVKVMSKGSGGSLIDFPAKVFLGREHDLFSTRSYCSSVEWNAIAAQDEYYQTHNTNADRVKIQKGGSAYRYWLMSPFGGNADSVVRVYDDGSCNGYNATSSSAVALRFAL